MSYAIHSLIAASLLPLPVNTAVLMLAQRPRRWANINTALSQRLVFTELGPHS